MKKAVVLEIKNEYAAVLTDEGYVQKILDENYIVGQEIELTDVQQTNPEQTKPAKKRFSAWYKAAAAAAIFVIAGSGMYYASENVFAYSTVTVTTDDTSMELTLNKKNEVVSVKALDQKSETAVSELHISAARRRPLSDTLDSITRGREEIEIEVAVRSGDEERRQKLEEEVVEMLPAAISNAPDSGNAQERIQNESILPGENDPAQSQGIIPGEWRAPGETGLQNNQPSAQNMGGMQPEGMPDLEQTSQEGIKQRAESQGAKQPEAVQPGAASQGTAEPGAAQQGTVQQGTGQPEAVHPGLEQPEAAQSEAVPQDAAPQEGMLQNGQTGSWNGAVQTDSPEQAGISGKTNEQAGGTGPAEGAAPANTKCRSRNCRSRTMLRRRE